MPRSEVTIMRILPARFWASWKTPIQILFGILQRVFETTFTINVKDLPDGSQAGLYTPTAVTDLNESSNSPVATKQ
jgi:hypothetical protein